MQKVNIVVLGAGGVGKSALVTRYVKETFAQQEPTVCFFLLFF